MLLSAQGMLAPLRRPARRADVLTAIRRMLVLQIDTIHVVARSPYLVLFSRLGPYKPEWLDHTHSAGKLFEYWSHAMCWMPSEDYPLFASLMAQDQRYGESWWRRNEAWIQRHAAEIQHVRERISAEGGLKSSDFEAPQGQKRAGVWWDWKVEKQALEYLFACGELMVSRREKFQRVYELRERVVPRWDPSQLIPCRQVRRQQLLRSALALGPAAEAWLRDYYRLKNPLCRELFRELLSEGALIEARIEGVKGTACIHPDLLPLLKKAEAGKLSAQRTAILSPFDPLVWDRERARALFDFDYTIEVYTPGHKRQYGYFSMPVLQGDRLIGRLDPKAHRREGVYEVRALHLEPSIAPQSVDWAALASELRALACWHGTPKISIGPSQPASAARQLRAALRNL